MKKLTALLMAALMIVSLTACGGSGTAPQTTAPAASTAAATTAPAPSESETPAQTSAPATTPAPTQPETTQPETTQPATTPAATQPSDPGAMLIDNITFVDNEYCTVTFVSGALKRSGGAEFLFRMKNNTKDMEENFSISDTSINGWMLGSLFFKTLAPGEEAESKLSFTGVAFKECGLTTADKMMFGMQITGRDGSSSKSIVNTMYTVNLTSAGAQYVSPEREKSPDETEIANDGNAAFVVLGAREDPIWGYVVEAYLENKSDKFLRFVWEDVSINGQKADPSWGVNVSPTCKKFSDITFSDASLKRAGVEKVEEIAFTLRVYDRNDKSNDLIKKTVTIRPGK